MKQRFLLSFLFVCSLAVTTQAQINKGATWLGGQAGYSQSSEEGVSSNTKNKQSSFNISPAVGTAVKDNLIVGISASYVHSKSKSGSTVMTKYNSYGGGVFIRKYIPVVSRLYIFGDAKVSFNAFRTDENISTNPNKIKGWNVGISATPGLSYAITNKIHIETGVNSLFSTTYEKKNQKQGSSEANSSSFNSGVFLNNNSPLFIGFRFLLNKKA
jgi:hypothetical protein